jgi:predicted transport protein|tara:strand:+ start:504 stop:728 length:225 start_codon:yes stop_codon:yes gene_type:complete
VIFGFLKKLIKYYVDKFVDWIRMLKLDLELENEIKKYHESFEKKKEPKIREVGKFGEDDWSISIGDIDDEDTKD